MEEKHEVQVENNELPKLNKRLKLKIVNKKTEPKAIYLDFKDIRKTRRIMNMNLVFNSIKENNKVKFYNSINEKELVRYLNDLDITFEEFWNKCLEDDIYAKTVSRELSKNASRQGTKDAQEQIRVSSLIGQDCGINITELSATAFRATKDGRILSKDELKKYNIKKDCCLKSFDASIDGFINGYISAKVVYGSGGHQDNVFEEIDTLAEWWSNYKKDTQEYLIILIDTDLIEKLKRLKEKYSKLDNIMIFNHFEFQEYMISNYYCPPDSI